MDRGDTALDFQRILVTEDESLDSHNNIITQLQLEDRLPEGRQTCERLLEDLGLQPAREDQGDRTCNQFVFEGQCLVLGDSGVGKTSLVKSLTGKPFDLEQPKTQGVEFCLVDQKWQNLNLKDLIFGNFSRFFEEVIVQLTIFGTAGNVIVQETTNVSNLSTFSRITIFTVFVTLLTWLCGFLCGLVWCPASFIIFYMVLLALVVLQDTCCFKSERYRLIVITCSFILNCRGLLMGGFLSVMLNGYFLWPEETPLGSLL